MLLNTSCIFSRFKNTDISISGDINNLNFVQRNILNNISNSKMIGGNVNNTNGEPIKGALIDVWQANDDGFYDIQQPEVQM